ncbi:MAG: hypothetical protein WAK55_03820 [Xanthobacteraceae bacterium]
METAKLNGSAKIGQSSDIDVGGNIHELLTRASDAIRRDEIIDRNEIIDDEIAADSLGHLVRRVSEASRREIEFLVSELQALDKKLQADCDHLQRDVEEYAELSQNVMQLTGIIADSVRKLPGAPGIIP